MNRRTALLLTALTGGWFPARLLAQESLRRAPGSDPYGDNTRTPDYYRRPRTSGERLAQQDPGDGFADEAPFGDAVEGELLPPAAEGVPPDFPVEPGQMLRVFDISRYTALPHRNSSPQNAIVEWIFRRTGSAVWHGERVAALSVGRTRLLAYHDPRYLRVVEEVVERFVNAQPSDILNVRVRFVAAEDTRWRYAVATRLNTVAEGPQGQKVYALSIEDAAMVRAQMQVYQGFKLLADQEVKMVNGQTLAVERIMDVAYVSGPRRDGAVGLGFQPGSSKLEEGVKLRISPLLTFEGDMLEVALDLQVNTVRALHSTRILTPREVGPAEMNIEVPEVIETRINQTIKDWRLGQSLLISAGVHPGILQEKGGFLNLRIPGTVPSKTELLVFLDIDTSGAITPRAAAEQRAARR